MDGTTVVINRRELEYSVAGLMGEQYPAEYIKHLVDRLHHQGGALRLLDLEALRLRGDHPLASAARRAGGHTEGSMNVLGRDRRGCPRASAATSSTTSVHQLVDPHLQRMALDPAVTGNHGGSKRGEKGAIRSAVNGMRVRPARARPPRGRSSAAASIGRTFDRVPGPRDPERRVAGQADRRLPADGDRLTGPARTRTAGPRR